MIRSCAICQNKDLANLIELAWNGKMQPVAISGVLGGRPTVDAIWRHLKRDVEGGWTRQIEVEAKPLRQRVYDLQRTLVDEVERRIALAKDQAQFMTEHDSEGKVYDWSEFFNILDKDMQAAIGSISKIQALADNRDAAKGTLAVGLAALMLGGADGKLALAPGNLVGDEDEVTIEGEAVEVDG